MNALIIISKGCFVRKTVESRQERRQLIAAI